MLLIYGDEKILDDTEREKCYVESTQLAHDLHSAGQYIAAAPLHPTSTAMSVRVRERKRLVTDGPFAETREQLGGYFLVEAKNIDEAIDIATRIPMARLGTVEVRPGIEIPVLPKSVPRDLANWGSLVRPLRRATAHIRPTPSGGQALKPETTRSPQCKSSHTCSSMVAVRRLSSSTVERSAPRSRCSCVTRTALIPPWSSRVPKTR